MSPLLPRFGTAVSGIYRFRRPELEAELDSLMNTGNGAKVFGLRRIGKSTEVLAWCDRARAANFGGILIELDAQGYSNEAILLREILTALPDKGWRDKITSAITSNSAIAKVAKDAIQKLSGMETDILAYFMPIMQSIESVITEEQRIVLVIDEFPWLCRTILESDAKEGKNRVDVLLATLRRWRIKGVRMLLLGSIGMTALGRQYQLDLNHLTDILHMDIPELARDQAQLMVASLARGAGLEEWTPAHTSSLLDECIALYPGIIQQAFQTLTMGKHVPRLEKIADLFADKIRPSLEPVFYSQFDKRLQAYRNLPAPMPGLVRTLLSLVMSAPQQSLLYPQLFEAEDIKNADEADIGDALAILREDGFLRLRAPRNAAQQWLSASSLVAAWWMQRRGGRT